MPDQEYTDAIALLEADHRKVEQLFEQYEGASGSSARKKLAQCRGTDVDLVALRDAMLARKQELMAQAEREGLPPAEPHAINLQPA